MKIETKYGNITVYEKVNTNKVCVVFVHGMGGQSEQFKPIYNYLSNTFHVISIDLFGHGQTDDTSSYHLRNMASQYCELLPNDKTYVIIAHSLGVAISVYMNEILKDSVKGMIWIGAQRDVNIEKRRVFLKYPLWFINAWRWYYRFGGIYCQSVRQYIFYQAASTEVKQNQLKWNTESRTTTLLGILREMEWPSISSFTDITIPIQLIVGEYDHVTPISATLNVFESLIHQKLQFKRELTQQLGVFPKSIHPYPLISVSCGHNPMSEDVYTTIGQITHFFQHLKILCSPPSQSKEYKMDDPYALKNFKKWRVIQGVSDCIGNSKFRAMKILREIDDEHNPKLLFQNFKNIGLVVDMSRDVPPYHPEQFQAVPKDLIKFHRTNLPYNCTGDTDKPMYIKQSFISKIPPQDKDVDTFVELCEAFWKIYPNKEIALHCHYGYNRTGFMIIAAMYKMGFINHIMEGVDQFKVVRAPGIKHQHFVDTLLLRYMARFELRPVDK